MALDSLDQHRQTLEMLSQPDAALVCRFAHENTPDGIPAECPMHVQNQRLGCPHGTAVLELTAITKEFVRLGILSEKEGVFMEDEIQRTEQILLSEDVGAHEQYTEGGGILPATVQSQEEEIGKRQKIVETLLQRITTP